MRIDGRNNAPAVGEWRRSADGRIVITNPLFSFAPSTGKRAGTITGYTQVKITAGVLSGTWRATGTALDGSGLPGFPKSGILTGTRLRAQVP